MNETLIHNIAITTLPNIGDIMAKRLIAYCGSAEAVFHEKKRILEKIPGIGAVFSNHIVQNASIAFKMAEKELQFIRDNNIDALFYLDSKYPRRLVHCEDGPVLLYSKGNIDFNSEKVVSIVGTRKPTEYGKDFCEKVVSELATHHPIIVSGLAFGIDICAHKKALNCNLQTVGVVAHGLDRLYPQQHSNTAKKMIQNGAILSDFKSGTKPDRENFPKRNRLVAGLSDITIVIESGIKGGSMITANLANDYNRDVFALPGRISDLSSEGCNALIKQNKAFMIESVKDIEYIMNWKQSSIKHTSQTSLFKTLDETQNSIVSVLSTKEKKAIDSIALQAKLPISTTASILLELEFEGIVRSFPGKMYQLN